MAQGDRETIEELLSSETEKFRKFVKNFLRKMKSPETSEIIREYLESGRPDLVIEYINNQSSDFNAAILAAFLGGATAETLLIASQILDNRISTSFDITYYNTVAELAKIQGDFVRQFNASNSELFRKISADMISGRYAINEAVKLIIENYGLTPKQFDAVQSYRIALENLSSNALQRELRDVKYDNFIRSSIDKGKVFTATEIERMVRSYRRNMIESRVGSISRTMAKAALETGRAQAALQIERKLANNGLKIVKEWRSKRDGRVRYTHQHGNLDGQVVEENKTFLSPSGARLRYPGDPQAPLRETINCRCMLLRYVAPIQEKI